MDNLEEKQPVENPIVEELNGVIDSICEEVIADNGNVEDALVKFRDYVMENHISKDKFTINSLNALVSLIGGQDGRVIQLLNKINSKSNLWNREKAWIFFSSLFYLNMNGL